MKIIFIHNSYQQRGGEDVIFEQEVELLKSHGHAVVVYRRSNSEIHGYPRLRHLVLVKRTIWASDTREEVARLIRREEPDLVHVHNTFLMISPSIYSACGDAGVPVVQTLHNYRLLCPGAYLMRNGNTCNQCVRGTLLHSVVHGCYRDSRPATATLALMLALHRARQTWTTMVDRYIALSKFAVRQFVEGGLPVHKMAVKPNFVQPDPGIGSGSGEYAVFIGRLSPEKGADILLNAWKRVRSSIPLLIIGDGDIRWANAARRSIRGIEACALSCCPEPLLREFPRDDRRGVRVRYTSNCFGNGRDGGIGGGWPYGLSVSCWGCRAL